MAILSMTADLKQALETELALLPKTSIEDLHLAEFRKNLDSLNEENRLALRRLASCCQTLLTVNGFALVRGMPINSDARALVGLGMEIGAVFQDLSHQSTVVVEASPTLASPLQGNQTEPLFLHTDFAMLEKPPAVTIIRCLRPDPMGIEFGRNGFAVAQHIVARHFGSQLLDDLYKTELPFAGRTPAGKDILLSSTLLSKPEEGSQLARVRFHPSRIHHGFRIRGSVPTATETRLLRRFQRLAREVRSEVALGVGDVLLINNRCTLHDRTRCTLEVGLESVDARRVQILFVQEMLQSASF